MKDYSESYSDLLRLWILRMLSSNGLMRNFVRQSEFRDDDIARALGLDGLIGVDASGFQRNEIIGSLLRTKAQLEARSAELQAPPHITSNCLIVTKLLNLCEVEQSVLMFELIRQSESVVNDVYRIANPKGQSGYLDLLGVALGIPSRVLRMKLRPLESVLLQACVLNWNQRPYLQFARDDIANALLQYDCNLDRLTASVVNKGLPPTLTYRDYPHLQESLEWLRIYIRKALKEKRRGVNIFIYGPPGTGKSELARIIGREMRAGTCEIAFQDGDGDALDGKRRLEALRIAQPLLSRKRSILVYDEAEDIFRGDSLFERSWASKHKAWMNRQFETNPMPVFWISNTRNGVDPAFIRRFDFALEVGVPPKKQRLKAYKRICQGKVSDRMVERFADCNELTPAVLAQATAVASRVCHDGDRVLFDRTVSRLVDHTLKAQGNTDIDFDGASGLLPAVYSLDFVNTEIQMAHLCEQLKEQASCRVCLYGPPGTGKTALGYCLSRDLDQPLLMKKASDLLSPYVGEAEQNIAAAFREAKADNAILMIDEVDSFLQDRSGAARSWEVTQVNEMLTQIERFDGVFIASTNLMDGIDTAALRRFDLKLKFDYLRAEQAVGLMAKYARQLKLGALSQGGRRQLEALVNCTPGDFANVARQHRFRKFESAEVFVEAVATECAVKAGRGRRKMGFS